MAKCWCSPQIPLLEVELLAWIKSLRSNQKLVFRNMAKTKAKQLARQPRFTSLYPTINECKWSDRWIEGFMRRNNLSNRRRTTVAQKLPEDLEPLRDAFLSKYYIIECFIIIHFLSSEIWMRLH